MVQRLAVALALLLVVGGAWAWAASMQDGGDGEAPRAGAFRVLVVGPSGAVDRDGVVQAEATPLRTLQALAAAQGFEVEVEDQPWIGGGCTRHYVVGIDGQRETSTGGWNYYTRAPGGEWAWGGSGADCLRLDDGAEVEWCWVELDVCRDHAP